MMHEHVLKEALEALKQIDPENTKALEMIDQFGAACDGQNTIIAVVALCSTIQTIIELPHPPTEERDLSSQAQQQINWHYHLAIAIIMKGATDAGVFDEFAAAVEMAMTELEGESTDH